jgi:fumarate hydratase subunit beta
LIELPSCSRIKPGKREKFEAFMERIIELPFTDEKVIKEIRAGDFVSLSGTIYTARDQAHKRIAELIEKKEPLPFDLKGNVIYYCGPTPPGEDGLFGSAGPTTSTRMDEFTPLLLQKGLKGTIGKGGRSQEVINACKAFHAVYFITFGGAGAYLATRIVKQELAAYPELGTEAVYRLVVKDFPAVAAIDVSGRSIF